jgi:hypothetical protein
MATRLPAGALRVAELESYVQLPLTAGAPIFWAKARPGKTADASASNKRYLMKSSILVVLIED